MILQFKMIPHRTTSTRTHHNAPKEAPPASSPSASTDERAFDETVVHDLLNPMSGVLGQLELISELGEAELSEPMQQRLNACLSSARDLSEMLVDLRFLTQVRSDEVPHQPSRLSVKKLLDSLEQEVAWPDNGTVCANVEPDHDNQYLTDRGGLAQRALHATARAAMRLASPRDVTVTAAASNDDTIQFTCRYAGPTLPDSVHPFLGHPQLASLQREHGFRVERARSMEMVAAIMQLLQGTLRYEPTDEGGAFILSFRMWKTH